MNILKKGIIQLFILSSLILGFIFFISSYILYSSQKKHEITNKEFRIRENINQFSNTIKIYANTNRHKLITSERVANTLINDNNIISKSAFDTIKVNTIIKGTTETQLYKISSLIYKRDALINRHKILDEITHLTNTYLSIWQKTNAGYIRICTNIPGSNQNPDYYLYIHKSSQIAQLTEKGEKYYLREEIVNDSRLSIFFSLYIDDQAEGIVQISINENLPAVLNNIFSANKYYKDKRVFYVDKEGNSLINSPINENFQNSILFKKMKLKHGTFNKIDFRQKIHGKYVSEVFYYKYISSTEGYIGISVSKKDFLSGSVNLRTEIIILFVSLWILSIAILYFAGRYFFLFKERIIQSFLNVGKRETDKIKDKQVNIAIRSLKDYFERTEQLIKGISEDDNVIETKSISKNDKIGEALAVLKNEFVEIKKQQEKLNEESKLRNEFSEGSAKINNLLRYTMDIEQLSFDIIKTTIEFLEVEQGALLIINDDNPDDVFLEMKASYAYDKKRLADKNIPIKSGLAGRCVLEKESIFLTEIPDNYTKIVSGFGETEAKSLALIPLIFNNEVQGIIEIASLKIIEKSKIEFLESVGENIASTYSNIKNTERTEKLLLQTQKQSDQIETQRAELQEKIDTHRRQNRNLDKNVIELQEIIKSIKTSAYVVEYDTSGVIIEVNNKITDILGIERDKLIEKTHKDLIVCDDYDSKYKSFWKKLKTGIAFEIVEKHISANKEEFDLYQIYTPVKNARGRIFRILSIGIKSLDKNTM